MQTVFTHEFIYANKGCYDIVQVDNLSFIKQPEITILTILQSEISLQDKIWYVFNNCDLTLKEKQLLGLSFAKVVLKYYTAAYPNDTVVSDCIVAAEACINDSTDKNKEAARAAGAARAARAAGAAARAAGAARAARAAGAAAEAAGAAGAAARAAEAAADKETELELLNLLINYVK